MADADLTTVVQRMIDAGEPEENIASVIRAYQPAAPDPQNSGGPTLAAGLLRTAPAVGRGIAGFAAQHPAGVQKVIGAGVSTAAGGIGAGIGGVPGAVVGASIRGVTPAQTTIRQVAGQLAGEAPAVATNAARALGIQNYAKETAGLKLSPADIIPKPNPSNAVEGYANSLEKGILRLYGPNGDVVSGPNAVSRIPSAEPRGVLKTIGTIGKGLGYLSAGMGATDFAQAVEPTRRDIGVMGIGSSQPTPTPEQTQTTNAANIAGMNQRLQQQQAARDAFLRMLRLR